MTSDNRFQKIQLTNDIAARVSPGDKDTVLWLHGYTLDSSSWEEIWSLLPGWRHIGLDLPGHGASAAIKRGASVKELGQQLAEVCRQQHIQHLVALSFGTITALQIAIELPDYFKSITLGAPSMAGGPQDQEMTQTYSKLIFMHKMLGRSDAIHQVWLNSPAWKGIESRPGLKDTLTVLVKNHSWAELDSFDLMKQFFFPPQQVSDFQHIRTAINVIVGEHEMPAFKEVAALIAENAQNVTLSDLPGAYHLCMLQKPEEAAKLVEKNLMCPVTR